MFSLLSEANINTYVLFSAVLDDFFQSLVLAVVAVERHAGVRASTVLFLYWLVVVIADVVPFYTILLEQVRFFP